ncbi:MAG: glycoside hydrolase family 3 C-terminal domain-containing protein [Bacteroidota bacterium]
MKLIRLNLKSLLILFPILYLSGCQISESRQTERQIALDFADSTINMLSLEEKISLLHGMGGSNSEFGDLSVRYFGIAGIEEKGIPPFYMGHGITGVRSGRDTSIHATYFTTPIAIGCSWDTLLYSQVAKAIAKELRATGNDLALGPTYNIIRHPLGGRNWESISEDPFLTARMAVTFTKTIQANGIVCGPKHFVANNQETNRFDINNEVDERTLREIYLPAFKAAVVEGGALNIMGAYNRLNGDYMCHNEYLLDEVLRKDWGFKGFVLSDFANGVKDTKEAVNARMNVEMHRPKYYSDSLLNMVKRDKIQEARVDTLLKDVLAVMHMMNLFQRDRFEHEGSIHSDEHIEVARKAAQKSPVLLKNDKVLPLEAESINSLAVIGPNAKPFPDLERNHANYAYYLQGGGSGRTYYFQDAVVAPYTGIENAVGEKIKLNYAQGTRTPFAYRNNGTLTTGAEDEAMIAEAVQKAKDSDAAVIVVGLSGFNETEGWDRNSAELPGLQNKLIQEVARVNANTTVVLIAGSYIDVGPWIDEVEALLYVPYCGEQIGNGIGDILFGKVNPSGKLPFSWPITVEDYPDGSIFRGKAFTEEGISNTYGEGIFVGYRWFDKEQLKVQFPFGYGMSYTQFDYANLELTQNDQFVDVELTVTNNGEMAGEEVIQLYLSQKDPNVEKALKELKGFKKVSIAPGQSSLVSFRLALTDFAYYDTNKKTWIVDDGNYEIAIGKDSRNLLLKQNITIDKKQVL